MADNSDDQVRKSEYPSWAPLLLVVIVAVFVIIGVVTLFSGKEKIPKIPIVTLTETPSCEVWERMYGVLPDNFPDGTFEIGSGQTWILRLKPNEPSGWVKFNSKFWTVPTNLAHIGFPDGVEIMETRHNYKNIKLGMRTKFHLRGEGCELLTTSETVKRRWY